MEEIRRAVVHRRRRHQQYTTVHDQSRERAVTIGVGVAKPVGFVDDDKTDGLTAGRADGPDAKRFVRDDGRVQTESVQQCAPLRYQHRRHDEREGFFARECHRESDVRFAESHGVGEQRSAVALDDRRQSLRRWDLMRGEPRGPRLRALQRRPVEQRARRPGDDRPRRRLARRPKRHEEGLRDRDEIVREDPGPARGGRFGRVRRHRQRGRQRARSAAREWRARPTRVSWRGAGAARPQRER